LELARVNKSQQISQQGNIIIDGKVEANVLNRLHHTTGYVAQQPSLLNSSIRQNLLWVKPDATDQELFAALKKASLDSFFHGLKDGLNTVVGDQGARLSGGEKQRLILARALLRQPALLVLDEPTSAIDTENEQTIMDALIKLKGHVTILLIAHRLSTIQHANHIIFLTEGNVEQYPNFASLIKARKDIQTIVERDRGQS
jgi:ATP-binding cassette subfamily C protein